MRKTFLQRAFRILVVAIVCAVIPSWVMAQGTTRYVYDDNGRLRAVISPTGEAAVYEYDAAGNFTAIRRLSADVLELLTFFPQRGAIGDQVTFMGVGFGAGVSEVSFNGVAARIIEMNSFMVVAEVPEGATTGPVTIPTARGTLMTPVPFTVIAGVRVRPSIVTVPQGGTQQFTAVVTLEGDRSVRWSVNSIDGGNPAVGTISASGLYTAPILPIASIVVRATSVATPSLFGEAYVTVQTIDTVRAVLAPSVLVQRGPSVSQPLLQPALSAGVLATTGPNISAISPNSVTRGTTVTITIGGANLGGATAIRFVNDSGALDSSISASEITVNADGTSLTAIVTVNGSAALGRRVVIVSAAAGHSQAFNVGPNTIEITAP